MGAKLVQKDFPQQLSIPAASLGHNLDLDYPWRLFYPSALGIPEIPERKDKADVGVVFPDQVIIGCTPDAVLQNDIKGHRRALGVHTNTQGSTDIVDRRTVDNEVGLVIIKPCLKEVGFIQRVVHHFFSGKFESR
jgi:hypothetical protein